MTNFLKKIILVSTLLLLVYYLSLIDCQAQSPNYIRVAVIVDTASFSLKISGFYELINGVTGKILYRGKNLKTTVTTYNGIILIAGKGFKTPQLLIKTDNNETVLINERMFKGNIKLAKKDNGHLLVINQINLEDYIKGILYHESSHYWPQEALKAQAVISRTYAVYQMQENKSKDYDVTSDIYSQVYGGKTSERYRTNQAVDDTKGQAITYHDKVIPAYFHATCGGHTEDASLLWNVDMPPLKGVVCNFCQDSPHFKWHTVLSLGDIEEKLADAGYKIKNITQITILGKDPSDRIIDLELSSDKKQAKISAKDFRNIIGPNLIRSTNFEVSIVEGDAIFEGKGWGHGVGLCQWGAYFMAKQGHNYQDILKFYYPETNVKAF